MHISDPTEKIWFRERMEKKENQLNFTNTGKKFILNKLIQAEGFEKFLAVKFVGTKRFGIDGGEPLIGTLLFSSLTKFFSTMPVFKVIFFLGAQLGPDISFLIVS